jgi:hypothetical protein
MHEEKEAGFKTKKYLMQKNAKNARKDEKMLSHMS